MRGKILEEIVQQFLHTQGYRKLDDDDPIVDSSTSEILGRGTRHEMDAMGQYLYNVPFVFPILLLGEAKCYSGKAVGVDIVRESIAVRKDVNENYQGRSNFESTDRRTECVALFSTSGFSKRARELSFAHGVYIVPMGHVLDTVNSIYSNYEPTTYQEARFAVEEFFSETGHRERLYFGALNGVYPVALAADPLPSEAFDQSDTMTVSPSPLEDSAVGSYRFEITTWDYDWSAVIEIPESEREQLRDGYFEIFIPTQIEEIQRFVRLRGEFEDDTEFMRIQRP